MIKFIFCGIMGGIIGAFLIIVIISIITAFNKRQKWKKEIKEFDAANPDIAQRTKASMAAAKKGNKK